MARALRIKFEGALYHAMARGNARADIFPADDNVLNFDEEPEK